MKLTADALQPAVPARQQLVSLGLGEIHVQPGELVPLQPIGQHIEQCPCAFHITQQSAASDRSKRHCAEQLGVVADTGALAGIRPGPVEHVLTVGMALAIQRQRRLQLTQLVTQQDMDGLPATAPAHTAAVFQR